MGAYVDGCADFDGGEIPLDDSCDERRCCGDNVWKQSVFVHFREDVFNQIGQFMADGLLAIAVAVEERVKF